MLVLHTLTPVFLLIGIGAWLQRSGFTTPGFLREANRLTYWLGLPALLFTELARSFHQTDGARLMLGTMGISTGLVIACAYLAARWLRVPVEARGTLVQGAFRGNLAFVGLPVMYAMPDTPLAGGMSLRAAAVVVIAPMMVLYNLLGVVVLLLSQHQLGWAMVRPFLRQLVATPPLLATLAGIGFATAGWRLPAPIGQAFAALGDMALPLGLLGVGGSLVAVRSRAGGRAAWAAALMKTMLSPAIGGVVGAALGLAALELKMVMVFLATPTAIISYAVAMELKGDEAIASGTIVLSVLLSLASLALIIAW